MPEPTQAELRRLGYAPKIYHRAHLMGPDGQVSALCFKRPRAIDLRTASWTLRDDEVTCPKCIATINRRSALPAGSGTVPAEGGKSHG